MRHGEKYLKMHYFRISKHTRSLTACKVGFDVGSLVIPVQSCGVGVLSCSFWDMQAMFCEYEYQG